MQPVRFLKVLVIGLGLAIVVALGFVIYGFVRLSAGTEPSSSVTADATLPTVTNLGQPEGSEIMDIAVAGGSRVVASVRGGGLPDRLVVVDSRTGQVIGTTYVSAP